MFKTTRAIDLVSKLILWVECISLDAIRRMTYFCFGHGPSRLAMVWGSFTWALTLVVAFPSFKSAGVLLMVAGNE